jgi:hypothetical protein
MQGGKLLVPLAHRKRLRGLDEAPGTFGVFFNIHLASLGLPPEPIEALQPASSLGFRRPH